MKIDSLGNKTWEYDYGDQYNYHQPRNIVATSDGGYIIGGRVWNYSNADFGYTQQSLLLKINAQGWLQWRKTYGTPFLDTEPQLLGLSDGTTLAISAEGVGIDSTYAIDYWSIYPTCHLRLTKINNQGTFLQSKYFDEIQTVMWPGFAAYELPISHDIVFCYTWLSRIRDNVASLFKVNSNLDSLWHHEYKNIRYDTLLEYSSFYAFYTTADGGFICGGDFGNRLMFSLQGYYTGWLLKLDGDGCEVENCTTVATSPIEALSSGKMLVFPNPAQDYVGVQYSFPEAGRQLRLQITEAATGRIAFAQALLQQNDAITLPTNNLSAGEYIVNILSGNTVLNTTKFTVIK